MGDIVMFRAPLDAPPARRLELTYEPELRQILQLITTAPAIEVARTMREIHAYGNLHELGDLPVFRVQAQTQTQLDA